MTEIVLISAFGKQICKPFTVNTASEVITEEEQIINSTDGQDATNKDSKVAEDI